MGDLDGAYFGASFPQVFLQSYPALVPVSPPKAFVPRVFGFKLHGQHSMIAKQLEDETVAENAKAAASSNRVRAGGDKNQMKDISGDEALGTGALGVDAGATAAVGQSVNPA